MAASLRSKVTSVIQSIGPSANLHASIVSHESVPMREEIFHPDAVSSASGVAGALHTVQRHVAESTQATRSLPVLGGVYWPDLAFTANVAVPFAHGLQGKVAWILASLRPASANAAAVTNGRVIEVSQDAANSRITLASNETCTADLWIFPKPGSLR